MATAGDKRSALQRQSRLTLRTDGAHVKILNEILASNTTQVYITLKIKLWVHSDRLTEHIIQPYTNIQHAPANREIMNLWNDCRQWLSTLLHLMWLSCFLCIKNSSQVFQKTRHLFCNVVSRFDATVIFLKRDPLCSLKGALTLQIWV